VVRVFAIVKAAGKQYRVGKDEELVVDRLRGEVGDTIELPVAFTADGDDVDLSPDGKVARAEILEHFRGKKIHVYKYKPKQTYRKKTGHRQEQTRIRITEV